MAETSSTWAEAIEREIMRSTVAAGVRLRFDKIALQLLADMKAAVAHTMPVNESIAFTITAPIRMPGNTIAALRDWLLRLDVRELSTTINSNEIRARSIKNAIQEAPRVIGFVHNPESHAAIALEIAESSIREPSRRN